MRNEDPEIVAHLYFSGIPPFLRCGCEKRLRRRRTSNCCESGINDISLNGKVIGAVATHVRKTRK